MDTRCFGPLNQRIDLVAIASARNIRRRYAIVISYDLFGHVVVELNWGRIDTRGQGRTLSFPKHEEAHRFVEAVLKRRGSAKKRLGVAYRCV
jgi:predicted DNA-binding WGR domain protein